MLKYENVTHKWQYRFNKCKRNTSNYTISNYRIWLHTGEISSKELALDVICEDQKPRSGADLLHDIHRPPQEESIAARCFDEVGFPQLNLLDARQMLIQILHSTS